jgi:hypothetical protein
MRFQATHNVKQVALLLTYLQQEQIKKNAGDGFDPSCYGSFV